jgi:hypothetical protein
MPPRAFPVIRSAQHTSERPCKFIVSRALQSCNLGLSLRNARHFSFWETIGGRKPKLSLALRNALSSTQIETATQACMLFSRAHSQRSPQFKPTISKQTQPKHLKATLPTRPQRALESERQTNQRIENPSKHPERVSKLEQRYERNIEALGGGRGVHEQEKGKDATMARKKRAEIVQSLNAREQTRQQRKTPEPSKEQTMGRRPSLRG